MSIGLKQEKEDARVMRRMTEEARGSHLYRNLRLIKGLNERYHPTGAWMQHVAEMRIAREAEGIAGALGGGGGAVQGVACG